MWAIVQMCPAMGGGAGNQLTLIETLLIESVPCVPCADQSVTGHRLQVRYIGFGSLKYAEILINFIVYFRSPINIYVDFRLHVESM